ncbi:MAG: hypothetical protein IPK26_02255 [Planctomycetes bacterium]|nr:hypothetical protein [Planctomycetota bacterium]
MKHREQPRPFLFIDDGFPESREYADNYVALADERPRSWLRSLLSRCRKAATREALPAGAALPCDGRTPTAA